LFRRAICAGKSMVQQPARPLHPAPFDSKSRTVSGSGKQTNAAGSHAARACIPLHPKWQYPHAHPTGDPPHSGRPRISAPHAAVAISSASRATHGVGPPETRSEHSLPRASAHEISCVIAGRPSTPRPTGTPAIPHGPNGKPDIPGTPSGNFEQGAMPATPVLVWRKQRDFAGGQVRRSAHARHFGTDPTQILRILSRADTKPRQRIGNIFRRFGKMGMKHTPLSRANSAASRIKLPTHQRRMSKGAIPTHGT